MYTEIHLYFLDLQ